MRKKKLRVAGAVDSNAAAIILQDYLNELTLRP
jgi:RNase H-fold protein (predicted Holliday junction resolvase)